MRHLSRLRFAALLLVALCFAAAAGAQAPDDCSLKFRGKDRKAVKTRTVAAGKNYTLHNGGDPITVAEWYDLVCPFEAKIKKGKFLQSKANKGFEDIKVTVRGFLLGAKYEGDADGDSDIHAEIGGAEDWDTDHIVVELSPSKEYCDARQTLWGLIDADRKAAHGKKGQRWIMKKPVEVEVTGYVFLDTFHGDHDYCEANGGRGLRLNKQTGSKVRGLWEIHPVTGVKVVGD